MNQLLKGSFFRGGGQTCSSNDVWDNRNHDESVIDQDQIQEFFYDLDSKCQNINDLSKSIQSQESQDSILKIIRQILFQSQLINQASRNNRQAREYIKQTLENLETLLDCITNTIISHHFITLQILKICNLISRLIFQYYANNLNIPLDQERQQSIFSVINQIEELLSQGGEQVYYNSIFYELFVIKICIEICPTNSEEGKEVFLNIIIDIQATLQEFSTDLLVSLAKGGLYLYNEIKKRKQRKIFKIIFYLEELKYKFIENIQQGQGINNIMKQLVNNYDILIKNSNDWLIRCSWIKIISELIIYKPIITLKQFQIVKNKHQLETNWENLIQQRIIKMINDKENIGIIQKNDENSNTNRILQQQIIKFQVIQNNIINGDKNLPKLEQMKEFSNQVQDVSTQQSNLFIEQLQNLPIGQLIQQLNEYSLSIIKYSELVKDFIEEIVNGNSNKQYLLQQIEQIICESDEMSNIWCQLLLHNDIIYDIFDHIIGNFDHKQQTNTSINLLINQAIQYFKIAELLDYNFNTLIDEYTSLKNKLLVNYLLDEQSYEILNITQNNQNDKVDKLLLKLQEIKKNNKFMITIEDLIYYIKRISIITQQIQRSMPSFILYNLKFLNIRSVLNVYDPFDKNNLVQIIDQHFKNEFFQQMFYNYSAIQTLMFIYEQIDDNRDVLINKVFNLTLQLQTGISLKTLQFNSRLEEQIQNQQIIYNKLTQYFTQINTLDQKIYYLNLLEYSYINMLGQAKIVISDIAVQLSKIEEYIRNQNLENTQTNLNDQLNKNFSLKIPEDIYDNKFIELITDRLELYKQLKQTPSYLQDTNMIKDMQLLQLIIENSQQKYENIQTKDILEMIQAQNDRFNSNNQDQVLQELDQSVLQIYKNYLIKINIIIQNLEIFKNQEKLNLLIQDIPHIINFIKFQVIQMKQLDQQNLDKYNVIVNEFQQIFLVDLQKVQDVSQIELKVLQSQVKKMSLDEAKAIIPSYKQLSDRAIDHYKKLSIKQTALQFINDQLTSEIWRVKEYFYFNCLTFHQYLDENNQKIVGQLLLIARFRETDYRIINTLKGKDQIQQMDALINNQWEDTQDQVINELQLRLNELQAIQLSLQSEERKDIRDELLQKHKILEQQLEQQIKNVNEIGDVLGVTIYFLKDIKRDLALIQNKLDNIIKSIDQIGQDIKFLRGKTPQQILEIRMQSVLQEKIYQDAQSVYVQMKTLEFNFVTNQETELKTPLFNIETETNGEIDEFLGENQKSSLLIHGAAGSGKSLTTRKIEEYLWLQYQKQCQNKLWQDIRGTPPQIPIFIQLPTLKDPKFNVIEETLSSQMYRFDQKQIDLLKDTAQKNQIRLIFIMDSYDELPQQYQGINLLLSNKIHLWKPDNQVLIPKVITTSRTEAFTTNDYRAWFWENDTSGFQSLKEIRLLPFDDVQSQDFLQQFSLLKLKISIYDLLQVIGRNQDKQQLFKDTFEVCQQFQQYLQLNLKQDNKSFLLDQNQLQKLIKVILDNKNVTFINQEQETSFSKLILGLWHKNLYNDAILQMNLQPLLETPYMLNIVVEVLPQMNNQVSQPSDIQQYFIKNHINLTQKFIDSTIKFFDSNQNIEKIESYKAEEVKKFKSYNGQQLSQDSCNIWETLIKNQFFTNWNVQSSFEHTVAELAKLQITNSDLFPIKNKDEEILVYKSLKSHQLTLFDFFNLFIEQFIENQRQKLIYSNDVLDQNQFEQDIYKYAIKLSILMFLRQETIIERKTQGILFRQQNSDPYSQFFEDADQYGSYRKQIRKCIPLSQKGNFYQFRHKSIQEFLLSKETFNLFENAYQILDLLDELLSNLRKQNKQLDLLVLQQENNLNRENKSQDQQRKQDTLVEILKIIETSFLNQINLQDTFNLGALKFIKIKLSSEDDLCKILYRFVLLSSVNKQFIRFSSNCLVIILQVSQFQSGQDFSKIIVSEISVDGAIFENCDLRFSKFDKVSIKGLNLNFSDISNCEWNMLYSNDLPAIKIDGLARGQSDQKVDGMTSYLSELSPNRQLILSYQQNIKGKDNILIWDSNSGEKVGELKGHKEVNRACFSHNGQLLLSYGRDQFLRLWDVKSFTQSKEQKLELRLSGLIFSEQDNKIAYYDFENLYIINSLEKLSVKVTIKLLARIYAIRVYEQYLITLNKEQEKMEIHLQQWNQISGEQIKDQKQMLPKDQKPLFGCFHKDLLLFIAFNDKTIGKFEINKFQQKGSTFTGHISNINCIDVSLDGKYLVSGGADSLIIIYDVKSCNKISTLIGHRNEVNSVQFSNDVKLITTCSDDGEIRFWDAKVNKQLENSSFIKRVSFSPDSNQLIYLNKRGQIIFNDLATGLQINEKITDDKNQIKCICLSYDGKYLLYSTGFLTRIFDLRLSKQFGDTYITDRQVLNVGYSSDGCKVFLSYIDNIILYDPKNWKELKKFDKTEETQLSSNYRFIMYLQTLPIPNEIVLLDFQTFKEQRFSFENNIHKFDLANNNKMLVAIPTESCKKYIIIWDLSPQSKPITQVIVIESEMVAIKISPNCQYILVGSENGNISTIDPQKKYIVHLIGSFQRKVKEIKISPSQRYLTAITIDPILQVLQIEERDWNSFIKCSIPQKLSFQTLIQDLKFENSIIKSHLGYNLKTIFFKKLENQKQQKN